MSSRRRAIHLQSIIPRRIPLASDTSPLGLGLDVATTEKNTSNPSALALAEATGPEIRIPFLIRWKTANPEITIAIIQATLSALAPRRPRKLCVDATSERFFAAELRRRLIAALPVEMVISSQTITHLGQSMTVKSYLGNQLINLLDDNLLTLPDAPWISDDFRLVKRDRGTFSTDIDPSGAHGDTFDAVKLAIHAVRHTSGPAQADPAPISSMSAIAPAASVWKNPLLHLFRQATTSNL